MKNDDFLTPEEAARADERYKERKRDTNESITIKSNKKAIFFLTIACIWVVTNTLSVANETPCCDVDWSIWEFLDLCALNLAVCLIVWVAFISFFSGQQGIKPRFSFLAIFSSLIVSSLIGYTVQRNYTITQKLLTEIKSYQSSFEIITDKQGYPTSITGPFNAKPILHGEFGEIERLEKTFINKLMSEKNDYFIERYAIGSAKFLDFSRLTKDKELRESKMMIRKDYDSITKYRGKVHALFANPYKAVDTENVSKDLIPKLMKLYQEFLPVFDAALDIDEKIVSENEGILNLLSSSKKAWAIKDNKLLFVSKNDLNSFNYHLAAIKDFEEKAESLMLKVKAEAK